MRVAYRPIPDCTVLASIAVPLCLFEIIPTLCSLRLRQRDIEYYYGYLYYRTSFDLFIFKFLVSAPPRRAHKLISSAIYLTICIPSPFTHTQTSMFISATVRKPLSWLKKRQRDSTSSLLLKETDKEEDCDDDDETSCTSGTFESEDDDVADDHSITSTVDDDHFVPLKVEAPVSRSEIPEKRAKKMTAKAATKKTTMISYCNKRKRTTLRNPCRRAVSFFFFKCWQR
jgi:hypothetical protein